MSTNSVRLSEIQNTSNRLRSKEHNPDPISQEWPRIEWPKEFKDLCVEFLDALVDQMEYAQKM